MTTDIDRAEVFSRPAARFDEDGQLEIRASSSLGCRRALWYAATGYQPTNPPTEESLTAMEAGNALEPVVLRAMERAGWQVSPADPQDPEAVTVRIGPNLLVTGHPDATGRMPLDGEEADSEVQAFLFGGGPAAPRYGGEMVVEVKTRGPEAFKRWRTLGAERSHPASVAQAAFYTLGHYGELRDAAIATMDTGGRTWDYEIIPADRLERALDDACKWLGELAAHHVQNGPDPDELPERDFSAGSWQCRSCPFLAVCLPGAAEADDETEMEGEEVSDQEAREAVAAYAEAQEVHQGAGEGQAQRARHPEGVDAPPGGLQGDRERKDGQPGAVHEVLGQLPQAQRRPRPGSPGRDRDGERVGVRPGQLDAPGGAHNGACSSSTGTAPPSPINRA